MLTKPNPNLLIPLIILSCLILGGCKFAPWQQPTIPVAPQVSKPNHPTPSLSASPTSSSTSTYTPTSSASATSTPSITPTATITPTLTITPSPTFNFPKVTVNKTLAACKWGPAKSYLWAWDLRAGDTGTVYGRAPVGTWLYVYMDRVGKYCWISPYVVDVVGDPNTVVVHQVLLPITNALYSAPTNIVAERDGDQVNITWDVVWMTQDDDYGYFLDVWVCQEGNFIWMPTSLPNQYENQVTFIDQPGCPEASGGKIYTVEKHGYTDPADIPWPP